MQMLIRRTVSLYSKFHTGDFRNKHLPSVDKGVATQIQNLQTIRGKLTRVGINFNIFFWDFDRYFYNVPFKAEFIRR